MEWFFIILVVVAIEAMNVAVIYQKNKLIAAMKKLIDAQDLQIESQEKLIGTLKHVNGVYKEIIDTSILTASKEAVAEEAIDVEFKVLK